MDLPAPFHVFSKKTQVESKILGLAAKQEAPKCTQSELGLQDDLILHPYRVMGRGKQPMEKGWHSGALWARGSRSVCSCGCWERQSPKHGGGLVAIWA